MRKSRLDVRKLSYFLEIVELGSLTRAAASLNVAQPALSLHLKAMEEALGTRLLDRGRAGVTPTEAGVLLAQRARVIIEDLIRTEDEVATLGADPMGEVRVGLPGTIGAIVALPLLVSARRQYPRITVNVTEAMSGFVADWLVDGQVDAAVLYSHPAEKGLDAHLLLEEELVLLSAPGSDLPEGIDIGRIADLPMVLPSKMHGLRQQVDRAFLQAGMAVNLSMEIDSYANIKRLVSAGFGASVLPLHAVRQEGAEGVLKISRFAAPGLWRGAYLAFPSGRPTTRAQAAIRGLLSNVVSDLHQNGDWPGSRLVQPS